MSFLGIDWTVFENGIGDRKRAARLVEARVSG
jgi:hypothetical protein